MAKTVYSLVLSAEVVAAVDVLAAREGKSRSALVNHILAEYACLSTPEKQQREIVCAVEKNAADEGFRTSISAGGTLTLRTALRYKYNPAVSYVLEMDLAPGGLGNLRVALRTQNQQLQTQLQHFFTLWNQLEGANLPQPPPGQAYSHEGQRYVRALRRPHTHQTGQQAGEAIAAYVSLLDNCLKTFFDFADSGEAARQAATRLYLQTLPGLGFVLDL